MVSEKMDSQRLSSADNATLFGTSSTDQKRRMNASRVPSVVTNECTGSAREVETAPMSTQPNMVLNASGSPDLLFRCVN
ncbi:unnamed protein product [Lasius platythorax]|uniref:Uncharacterized protein n=1 Tax=Lasius platythorax TaxID=488582 RepID=A0AAV2NL64_9HYME